jgi:hypothetical protein
VWLEGIVVTPIMVLVRLLLGAVVPATAATIDQAPPADFAIRFEYGACSTDILDTFRGVFVRDMGAGNAAASVPVVLSTASVNAVYHDVLAAAFFGYPAEFRVKATPPSEFRPAMHYRLQVRSGGAFHTVRWTDSTRPSTAEADRLRDLFTRIIKLITDQPAIKRLPLARGGCE